jgi:NDP-sugar pyrophosphorylase family protein
VLSRIKRPDEPFIVMNGDVLSDLSHADLLAAHRASGADLTIAAFERRVRDELGIIDADDGDRVVAYHEKPEREHLVSMGIYALDPSVVDVIPQDTHMDFPELVQALLEAGRLVRIHRHDGYWMDLGRPDDFARANEEFGTRLGLEA